MPTSVISMRIPEKTAVRLKRIARQHGWSVSDTSSRLVEEALRRDEFPGLEFRDSKMGRHAFVQGTRLAVWQVALIARNYKNDAVKTAEHLGWSEHKAASALNYANAFKREIQEAIDDYEAIDFDTMKQSLPGLQAFKI